MGRGLQGALLRALGAREFELVVVQKRWLAPTMIRIRFQAEAMLGEVRTEPADWLRLWFPDPKGSQRQFQRGYTIVNADANEQSVELDFLIHEPSGPGASWALTCEAGDKLVAQSLGSTSFALVEGPIGLTLIGDSAAIPAINSIAEALPLDTKVVVLLEVEHDVEAEIPLAQFPFLQVHRVHRRDSETLAQAVEELSVPLDNWQVWAATESKSLKPLRKLIRSRKGFTKENTHTQGYWVQGLEMGTTRQG